MDILYSTKAEFDRAFGESYTSTIRKMSRTSGVLVIRNGASLIRKPEVRLDNIRESLRGAVYVQNESLISFQERPQRSATRQPNRLTLYDADGPYELLDNSRIRHDFHVCKGDLYWLYQDGECDEYDISVRPVHVDFD